MLAVEDEHKSTRLSCQLKWLIILVTAVIVSKNKKKLFFMIALCHEEHSQLLCSALKMYRSPEKRTTI